MAASLIVGSAAARKKPTEGYIMHPYLLARLAASAAALATVPESALALSFVTVEAGNGYSCGVSDRAQLWCWGANNHGVLGAGHADGAILTTPRPVGLEDVSAVTTGKYHACAIAGGRAWCWGSNSRGQLGVGEDVTISLVPVAVGGELEGRTDVTAIGASYDNSCAIAGGAVYCWGRGDDGQVGHGELVNAQFLPAPVQLGVATELAVGDSHACALSQGFAWCWGWGGALGHGGFGSSAIPVPVQGIPPGYPVEHLTAGKAHTCASRLGQGYCWGQNSLGQLGTGSDDGSQVALPVTWNQPAAAIDMVAGNDNTCAIDAEGRAWCWGADAWGQLGNDFALEPKHVPTPVYPPFASDVTALSVGWDHSCGIAGGMAYCWGRNTTSQLGTGNVSDFVQLPIAVNVDRILDAGFEFVQ